MHAVSLFLCGISMNSIAQIFDVAPPTVMRWVNYFKEKLKEEFPQQKNSYKKIKIKDLLNNFSAEDELYIDSYTEKVMVHCNHKTIKK
jgi:transposase-like protein